MHLVLDSSATKEAGHGSHIAVPALDAIEVGLQSVQNSAPDPENCPSEQEFFKPSWQ